MGNAPEEVKAAVRYVTAPHDRDGVAVALDKFCPPAKNGKAPPPLPTGRRGPGAKR
jgi:hypothetical protein